GGADRGAALARRGPPGADRNAARGRYGLRRHACPAVPVRSCTMPPRDGATEIRRIIDGAEDVKPEPPRPLFRELPPADLFPIDALGDVLGAGARAIHDRVQAPIALGAQSVLAAATLAVQAHADVVLPVGPSQAKPLSNYFVTVAATGERKTACDAEA